MVSNTDRSVQAIVLRTMQKTKASLIKSMQRFTLIIYRTSSIGARRSRYWASGFLRIGVVINGLSPLSLTYCTLLVACLIYSRALGYAIIVALPDDVSVGREGKKALDCLAGILLLALDVIKQI